MNIALVYLWAHAQAASASTREAIAYSDAHFDAYRRSRAAWRLYDQTRLALGIPRRARFTGDPLEWAA